MEETEKRRKGWFMELMNWPGYVAENFTYGGKKATEWRRKQWHGPYFSSMRLELMKNREGCVYEGEYLLNTKPLQIDMLAKTTGEVTWVVDEMTKGFRRHNIIEFKSPDDALNLDVFYKIIGYGCLYKAQGNTVDAISKREIAITFIRERKPEKLLQELERAYGIVQRAPGIYEVLDDCLLFPVQILVLREMNWRKHIWITALQKHISLEHAKQLVLEIHKLRYADEREWADAVLQLAIANNKEIFEKMKEEEFMCQALRELMAPEIDEELTKAERKGKNAGITILFETMQRLKNGETVENLRKSGWDEKTLDVALAALRL